MTDTPTDEARSYEIVSVQRAARTSATEGSTWHRYVIAYAGRDTIQGCRQGSLDVVTEAVEDMVAQLNARHGGRYGRVHVVLTPKTIPTSTDRLKST
jgi:hypothetical protein